MRCFIIFSLNRPHGWISLVVCLAVCLSPLVHSETVRNGDVWLKAVVLKLHNLEERISLFFSICSLLFLKKYLYIQFFSFYLSHPLTSEH